MSHSNLISNTHKGNTPMKCTKRGDKLLKQNVIVRADSNNEKSQDSKSSILANITNNEEKPNITEVKNEIELPNFSQNSFVTVRKLEDLCKTLRKNTSGNLENIENIENIKKENNYSSEELNCLNLSIDATAWNSQNIKVSPGTPTVCKRRHSLSSSVINSTKKRKFSFDLSDYDQLSDTCKSELCNTGTTDMEPIDMLHDLNFAMDFEEIKIPIDYFNLTENSNIENDVESAKDSLDDPLLIANFDEHTNMSVEDVNCEEKNNQTNNEYSTDESDAESYVPPVTRSSTKNKFKTEESSNVINDILGEVDIEEGKENDGISQDSLKKLHKLEVQLIHDVPPQHMIEQSAGTKALTKSYRQLFMKHGPLKTGAFTPHEDDIIMNNWKKFCEVHKWNVKHVEPFLRMKLGNRFNMRKRESRKKFVQFLANGLPSRSLFSVYYRFKYLHKDNKRNFKRYTAADDEKVLSFMEAKNAKKRRRKPLEPKSALCKALGRTSHSITLRYNRIKKKREYDMEKPLVEVEWTLPMIGKFIKTFMDVMLCEEVESLKNTSIPKPIWLKIEERLNVDYCVLQDHWALQLHMQLFCKEPIYLNDVKIKLIEHIYAKGITSLREIRWPSVAKYFDGATTRFICRIFYYLVYEATTKYGLSEYSDIIEFLYKRKISKIQRDATDKFLPRLSYSDGQVTVVEEDQIEDDFSNSTTTKKSQRKKGG